MLNRAGRWEGRQVEVVPGGIHSAPSASVRQLGARFRLRSCRAYTSLVDWFNKVDATYHADLRELNELNFARFDAKLEQRIAELRSEVRQELSQLETRLIRWMFLFWVGTVGTLIALSGFWA